MTRPLLLAALAAAAPAFALPAPAVPLVLDVQGRLLDGGDQPVEGAVVLKFSIYPVDENPSVGDPIPNEWTATYNANAFRGVFRVLLGDTSQGQPALRADLFDGTKPRWLGVAVGSDAEMRPRMLIGSTAFALLAGRALDADHAAAAGTAALAANADALGGEAKSYFAAAAHDHEGVYLEPGDADLTYWRKDASVNAATLAGQTLTNLDDRYLRATGGAVASLNVTGAVAAGSFSGDGTGLTGVAKLGAANAFTAANTFSNDVNLNGTVTAAGNVNLNGAVTAAGGIRIGNVPACTNAQTGTLQWNGAHFYGCAGFNWVQLDVPAVPPPPSVASVSPANGRVGGGTALFITGDNFRIPVTVRVGASAAAVTALTTSSITATSPAASGSGTVDVTVTNVADGFFATVPGGFTYHGDGTSQAQAAKSCLTILQGGTTTSNPYWIDPNGGGTNDAFQVYCEMQSDGGGWTLVSKTNGTGYDHIGVGPVNLWNVAAADTGGSGYIGDAARWTLGKCYRITSRGVTRYAYITNTYSFAQYWGNPNVGVKWRDTYSTTAADYTTSAQDDCGSPACTTAMGYAGQNWSCPSLTNCGSTRVGSGLFGGYGGAGTIYVKDCIP